MVIDGPQLYVMIGLLVASAGMVFLLRRQGMAKTRQMELAISELQKSEERYRTLAKASPVGVFRTDPNGAMTYVNPKWCEISGLSASQALGSGWLDAVHPDDREKLSQGWQESTQLHTASISDYRFVRPDRTITWVMGQAAPEMDSENQCVGYVGTITDITERKQAETALQQSEGQYRALVEQAADGIFIAEAHGRYLAVNTSGCAMLGYTREEILGKDYTLILSPEDVAHDPPRLDTLRDGKIISRERLYKRKDGTIFPVEIRAKMLSDGRIQSIVRDITERKRAEVERQHRVDQLAALNDAALQVKQHLDADEIYRNACDELRRFGAIASVYHIDPEGQLRHVYTSVTIELLTKYVARFGDRMLDFVLPVSALASAMEQVLTRTSVLDLETLQHLLEGTPPEIRQLVDWMHEQLGPAPMLLAPLTQDGKAIDLLAVVGNSLDEEDVPAVTLFAQHVSVALENARLFAAEQARRAELAALYDLSRAFVDAGALDEVLNLIVQGAVQTIHVTFARIASLKDDELRIRATYPIRVLNRDSNLEWRETAIGEEWRRRVLDQTAPLVLYADDPSLNAQTREMFFLGIAASVCLVPLYANNVPIGLLILAEERSRGREPFSAEKQKLARAIADQAASAMRRAALHEETARRVEQLEALKSIDRAITASFDLPLTLNVLLEHVSTQLHVDAAAVLLLDPHLQTLDYAAGRGFRTPGALNSHIRLGEDFAGRAALERKIVRVDDFSQIQARPQFAALWADEGFAAYYGVPLIVKGLVKGVLEVYQRAPFHPGLDWISFMEMLAGEAALAIDNAQLFLDLEHSNTGLVLAYDSTIEGWSRALDLRDKETEGHTQRVTEITLRLAKAMGIGDAELVHIRRGALLHDIGKMGVPDRILLKPGGLDEDEWVIMRKHPVFAYELLSPIAYLYPALDIPYCHHERWDGMGYPRGLRGHQIPRAARIFAVVDVWDALRSDRPYRGAWPAGKAHEYIRSQANSHFDSEVVEPFFRVMGEKGQVQ